jgi:uncharacterized membrane protein
LSTTAIILLVVSAVIHAGWNILGKRTRSTPATYLVASVMGAVILAPFPILSGEIVAGFTVRVWLLVFSAGAFMTVYYVSLAMGYRRGDMSLVYPVARATPAILVVLVSVVAGRGNQITLVALAGIGCILLGAYLLPMIHLRDFKVSNYLTPAYVMALCAAIATTGYSTIDDAALSLLRDYSGSEFASWRIAGVYAFFEAVSTVVWLLLYMIITKRNRTELRRELQRGNLRTGILIGLSIHITYTIVLVSMAFVRDVSYVVAFRQLSIPMGVALSAILLREKLYVPKVIGASLMFIGVVIVGLG